jgi:hypothetical protein
VVITVGIGGKGKITFLFFLMNFSIISHLLASRKVIRAYQDSWDHRCRLLFCCMGNSDRSRNSFTEIARLLSDFFRDLDVVPSDVVAGLVLLRKFQILEREAIVRQVSKWFMDPHLNQRILTLFSLKFRRRMVHTNF